MKRFGLMIAAATAMTVAPLTAFAMCGCMMPIDDTGIPESTTLTSDATQVVMMRSGQTTIQTMQNRYEGPLEDFALIVPTPEILSEDNVKTLDFGVFDRIDQATAPRLIEYWEHDPCESVDGFDATAEGAGTDDRGSVNNANNSPPSDPGVIVEAEFTVGEYDIQILSASDGILLEDWLTDEGYRIPKGASKYLQPYIDGGMYFFVAKVDVDKVRFNGDDAVLSPLRFHYDTPDFTLPTRLGMMNSQGRQDLVVYTLAESRMEVANMPNTTIPTNVAVQRAVKEDFALFYDQLFDRTLTENGSGAVTEFASQAWMVQDLETLGGDVARERSNIDPWNMVVSRLHLRYEKDGLGEDIVFRGATPIIGGQEMWNERTVDPTLITQGAQESEWNQFQATFVIKNAWTGAVDCESPTYNRWGGKLDDVGGPTIITATTPNTTGTSVFLATNPDKPLEQLVAEDVPEISLEHDIGPKASAGCASKQAPVLPFFALVMVVGFAVVRRRRAA